MFSFCLLKERKEYLCFTSVYLAQGIEKKVTYSYTRETYSDPKVTYNDPKVTHSDPTHLPLPHLHHLSLIRPLVE